MKYLMPAIRMMVFMTILLGLVYPLVMTGLTQFFFPQQSSGSFVSRGGQIVGSTSIAQNFEKLEYFWPRPSAAGYNPMPSGGSNLSQTSQDLKKTVDERKAKLKAAHLEQPGEPPQDLLFASSSGLDPHISPAAAEYQIQRVAKARNMEVQDVENLVTQSTRAPQLGIFGEPIVNVLALNMALDKSQGNQNAPTLVPRAAPSAADDSK